MKLTDKKDKNSVTKIQELATTLGVEITTVDKHNLNLLCDNR